MNKKFPYLVRWINVPDIREDEQSIPDIEED